MTEDEAARIQMRAQLRKYRAAGRITLLIDGLDHAWSRGNLNRLLDDLLKTRWSECPVWITGRPWAFRQASPILRDRHPNRPWQFVRVGQLLEPECRFLLETMKPPGQR